MAYDSEEKQKAWRSTNRDNENEKARKWREANPDKVALAKRKINLKQFGMTIEQYDRLFEKQKGLCAICKQPDLEKRLAVDHCHEELRVRGLLYGNCNRALGLMKDDPEAVLRAYYYLYKI